MVVLTQRDHQKNYVHLSERHTAFCIWSVCIWLICVRCVHNADTSSQKRWSGNHVFSLLFHYISSTQWHWTKIFSWLCCISTGKCGLEPCKLKVCQKRMWDLKYVKVKMASRRGQSLLLMVVVFLLIDKGRGLKITGSNGRPTSVYRAVGTANDNRNPYIITARPDFF